MHTVFSDGQLYDAEYRTWRADARFYRRAVSDALGGPAEILELACGTGRVSVEMARDGHHVFGFDVEIAMLRKAAKRVRDRPAEEARRIHLFAADMRNFHLRRRFAVAVCAFNSFEHLYHRDDVLRCLSTVRAHLSGDGLLIFDVHNPDPRVLSHPPTRVWGRRTFRDHQGAWIRRELRSRYHRDTQVHEVEATYQPLADDKKTLRGPAHTRTLTQRQFWPQEIDALVREGGFEIAMKLGDFDHEVFCSDSTTQILFCQPKAGR